MPMMFDSTYKPDSKRVKHFCDYYTELATELFEYSFLVIPDDEVVPPGKRENRMVAWKRRTLIVLFIYKLAHSRSTKVRATNNFERLDKIFSQAWSDQSRYNVGPENQQFV